LTLLLVTTAFILASGAIVANAQESDVRKTDQLQWAQQDPAEQDGPGMMGHEGMMRHCMGMMRHGMIGQQRMMGPFAMRLIFALMDSDGDGTISLQEFQAAHERIFKAMDADKDGTVTLEEMQGFLRGTGKSPPQQ
jgi:hypothetical protein